MMTENSHLSLLRAGNPANQTSQLQYLDTGGQGQDSPSLDGPWSRAERTVGVHQGQGLPIPATC